MGAVNNQIYYITGNEKKFSEAKLILPQLKMLSIGLKEIQSLDPDKIAEEKAKEALKVTRVKRLVVDDVSLYLECLDDKLPGPLIKWFLSSITNNGIYTLAKKFGLYGAKAVCTLCYAERRGRTKIIRGVVSGHIVKADKISKKSWDEIFVPNGSSRRFSEMRIKEKNLIGHRGMAVRKLKRYLKL